MPDDYGTFKQLSAIKDLQISVDRLKTNDLAHINTRLNLMDIKLATMSSNLSWLTKLAGILTAAIVTGIVGVILRYMEII
tara:strand:+ start:144 stop:383 length:240 start_codon:yes stop_codon:yes gene_type:complete